MIEPKQVIVMRRDLKMRRGKEIAQGAHASLSFLTRRVSPFSGEIVRPLTEIQKRWLSESFVKICLRVNSEQELFEIQARALHAGLEVHVITDSGRTEFGGVPTPTCLAIGPDEPDKIDKITGHLELL